MLSLAPITNPYLSLWSEEVEINFEQSLTKLYIGSTPLSISFIRPMTVTIKIAIKIFLVYKNLYGICVFVAYINSPTSLAG
jgi:hypothetical protein